MRVDAARMLMPKAASNLDDAFQAREYDIRLAG
jgi:hypothetical protein